MTSCDDCSPRRALLRLAGSHCCCWFLTFRTVSEDQTVITPHFICGVCVGKILKAHFGNNAQKCLELIEKKDEKALEELVKPQLGQVDTTRFIQG